MKLTKKTKKTIRGIWGSILTVLALPFAGVFLLVMYVGCGLAWLATEFWSFTVDLWRRITDPGYQPIGMYGMMLRGEYMKLAAECWSKGDIQEATALWRKAARLYDNHALFRLGECYEMGNGVELDMAKAYECYRLADIFHNEQAEAQCTRLEQFAMNRKERNKFMDTIWTKK